MPEGNDIAIDAYIDKKTGWPIKIVERERAVEAKLIPFGNKHVIANPLEFFPVELFAIAEPGEFTAGVNKIVITTKNRSARPRSASRSSRTTSSNGASSKSGKTAPCFGIPTRDM